MVKVTSLRTNNVPRLLVAVAVVKVAAVAVDAVVRAVVAVVKAVKVATVTCKRSLSTVKTVRVTPRVANVAVAVDVPALPVLKVMKVPMSNVLRPVDTVIDTLARIVKKTIPSTARMALVRLTVAAAKKAVAKVALVAKRKPMMLKLMKPPMTLRLPRREKKDVASSPIARNVLSAESASKKLRMKRRRRRKSNPRRKSASLLMTTSTSKLPNQLVSLCPARAVTSRRLPLVRLRKTRIPAEPNSL